jgi:hypothetical protein
MKVFYPMAAKELSAILSELANRCYDSRLKNRRAVGQSQSSPEETV